MGRQTETEGPPRTSAAARARSTRAERRGGARVELTALAEALEASGEVCYAGLAHHGASMKGSAKPPRVATRTGTATAPAATPASAPAPRREAGAEAASEPSPSSDDAPTDSEPIAADPLAQLRVEVHLREFEALKEEQAQRIGFRDNMLYVTLLAVGGIAAYALEGAQNDQVPGLRRHALLIIPWVCVVLGWTSVMNDEKITAIGDYIKKPGGLGDAVHAALGGERGSIFRWEDDHRSDDYRQLRKLFQLAVDLTAFVFSGAAAMWVFHSMSGERPIDPYVRTLMYVEGVLLTLLAGWILKYSGLWSGGPKSAVVKKRAHPRQP